MVYMFQLIFPDISPIIKSDRNVGLETTKLKTNKLINVSYIHVRYVYILAIG